MSIVKQKGVSLLRFDAVLHVLLEKFNLQSTYIQVPKPVIYQSIHFQFSGEMCMSLLWYYRPEHVDSGRKSDDLQDEIFASKHRDFTSVACIEDKCYVMTFNEYCRYEE